MKLSDIHRLYVKTAKELDLYQGLPDFSKLVINRRSTATLFGRGDWKARCSKVLHLDIPEAVFDAIIAAKGLPPIVEPNCNKRAFLLHNDRVALYRGHMGSTFEYCGFFTYLPSVMLTKYLRLRKIARLCVSDEEELEYYHNLVAGPSEISD